MPRTNLDANDPLYHAFRAWGSLTVSLQAQMIGMPPEEVAKYYIASIDGENAWAEMSPEAREDTAKYLTDALDLNYVFG